MNENKTTARMKIERFENLEIWQEAEKIEGFWMIDKEIG